jgi:hypothetical protein
MQPLRELRITPTTRACFNDEVVFWARRLSGKNAVDSFSPLFRSLI